jgi:hypothetical protein
MSEDAAGRFKVSRSKYPSADGAPGYQVTAADQPKGPPIAWADSETSATALALGFAFVQARKVNNSAEVARAVDDIDAFLTALP